MKEVLVHAARVTFFSILASLVICWTLLSAMGMAMDGLAVTLSIVCPTLVAFPASAYSFDQKRKIAAAHAALTQAHCELATMHEKLAERARRDDLTGLLNRSAFIAAVEERLQKNAKGALLLLDADNFKRINDTYGHLEGDEALRIIARALAGAVRRSDVKGRLGGEEFGIFLAGADLDQAFGVAERVRQAVEEAVFRPGGYPPVRLTVSIGVAAENGETSFSRLMGTADKRLYEAKRRGRNVVVTGGASGQAAA